MKILRELYSTIKHAKARNTLLSSLRFGSRTNDYFLISFPKSGNTWVRFLLANLLKENNEIITLKNVGDYVPDIHIENQRKNMADAGSLFNRLPFRFVKTHDEYLPYYKDKKVIYIVRDGRDTLNSYFYYVNARREQKVSMRDLISSTSNAHYTGWSKHVLGWKRGTCERKIILKYEDMISNAYIEVKKMLEFIEWPADDDKVCEAIASASFDKLKQIEEKYGGANEKRTEEGKSTPFFRKGVTKDWANSFEEEDIKLFWKMHDEGMEAFDYCE